MWRFLFGGRGCCYCPFCTKASLLKQATHLMSTSLAVFRQILVPALEPPNTGNNPAHSPEGQSEVATKANIKVQLCEKEPPEPRFSFLDLERRARIIPCQIAEFRKYQKISRTFYLEQLYLWVSSYAFFYILVYLWNEDRCT